MCEATLRQILLRATACIALLLLVNTSSRAENTDIGLIQIGPRFGLSGQTFLGKEQKYNFQLYDVAALFRLPWKWQIGQTRWGIETRLITSAGVIHGAGENGLMATIVPTLAVTNGAVSLDGGPGLGFFSNYKFGNQDFGGPVQIIGTIGINAKVFSHAFVGFRLQHFSDATLYGQSSLGVDMYLIEGGYKF